MLRGKYYFNDLTYGVTYFKNIPVVYKGESGNHHYVYSSEFGGLWVYEHELSKKPIGKPTSSPSRIVKS